MVKFTPDASRSSHDVEVSNVEFTEEDWTQFRASPVKFLRGICEAEGYKVNRLLIDARVFENDDNEPPGICHGIMGHGHVNSGPNESHHLWWCSGNWE
ncbi:hypothetical protein ACIQVT_14525 [Streptomyces sp. NPDC100445]|uniref:hypothetical protein n=1 Tax=Streptomyces sp. NPDC100445 TaxID=3366102 RepID=UPI00380C59D5